MADDGIAAQGAIQPDTSGIPQHDAVDKSARPSGRTRVRYVDTELPSTEQDQEMMDTLYGQVDVIPDTQEGTEQPTPRQPM